MVGYWTKSLYFKTLKTAKDYKAKSIILAGGVAANKELRKQFEGKIKREIPYSKFYIPDSKFCTDNAAMVAVAGYFNRQKKRNWKKFKANANLKIGEKAKRTSSVESKTRRKKKNFSSPSSSPSLSYK